MDSEILNYMGPTRLKLIKQKNYLIKKLLILKKTANKMAKPRVDLRELANLCFRDGWSRKQLSSHCGGAEDAIQNFFSKNKEEWNPAVLSGRKNLYFNFRIKFLKK